MAQLGIKPLLIERSDLGGTCTNKGCIPTKSLIHVAKVFRDARQGERMGIRGECITLDFTRLQQWNRFVVEKVRRGIKHLLDANGVEVVKGEAHFVSPRQLAMNGTGEELSSDRILIATGSRPSDLPCMRLDSRGILSSDDVFQIQSLPSALAIVGGGVVGVEMATAFAYLGTKVTIIELMGQILPGFDAELIRPVHDSLVKAGVEFYLGCSVAESGYSSDGKVKLTLANGRTIQADRALVAVGRRPNTQTLDLHKAGVEVDDKGFIRVNEYMESSSKGIYAAGDTTGLPYLAHRAMDQGHIAAWNACRTHQSRFYPQHPSVIYSDPEIAVVGMGEQACTSRGIHAIVGTYGFGASGRAQTTGRLEGFVKIVAEKNSQKIVGVSIVGQSASELIGGCSTLIRTSATLADLSSGGFPHPTLSEAIMEAARSALGKA
jgi:dihydrolipoamide dehydrogenase